MVKSATYVWTCPSATECTKLTITIRTEYRGSSSNKFLQARVNAIELSTRSLLSRGQIDFSCTSSSLLMGVNYKSLRAVCAQLSGKSNNSNSYPARSVGSTMENSPGSASCTRGFVQLGLFGGGAQCK